MREGKGASREDYRRDCSCQDDGNLSQRCEGCGVKVNKEGIKPSCARQMKIADKAVMNKSETTPRTMQVDGIVGDGASGRQAGALVAKS